MRSVLVATMVLTRVPVPLVADAADVGRAARWFPIVGALIGVAGALAAWAMREAIAMPPALAAVLLVGLGAWVTGAIHLDGLADMADGFGGGRTREEVLRIMRDPAIGSYGAVVLVIVLLTKVAALITLLAEDDGLPFLVAAPVMSRWTIVALGTWLPYARAEGGVGRAVTCGGDKVGLLVATSTTAVIAFGALRASAILPWAMAAVVVVILGRAAHTRIGGVTGDVFGAGVELAETAVLVAGALITARA